MAEALPPHNGGRPKISTLVFMDLESTGLPFDVGKRNVHITEMSFIAVDRNSFEEDKSLRVLNKISLCVRPRSMISPGAMDITGLYNDLLESQEEFDDSVPKLLEYFFRRLQKPICLLAHNGNKFDFPVLQAELNRLNYALGSDIVCADTLVAFRAICQSRKQAENERNTRVEDMTKSAVVHISEKDIDSLLSQDIESFAGIDVELESIEEKALESDVLISENGAKAIGVLSPNQDLKTPLKNKVPFNLNPNVRKRKMDPTYHPKNEYKARITSARRTLFPDPNSPPPEIVDVTPEVHKITKFSLPYLYHYFFNENPPNSHYAEIDCISLSKVCQKVNQDFLNWVDDNNVAFSTIDAMW